MARRRGAERGAWRSLRSFVAASRSVLRAPEPRRLVGKGDFSRPPPSVQGEVLGLGVCVKDFWGRGHSNPSRCEARGRGEWDH